MSSVRIGHIRYVLGESRHNYTEANRFSQLLRELNIADDPQTYGWGSFYRTAGTVGEMGIESGKATLRDAGLGERDVDLLIFCCNNFGHFGLGESERFYHKVLSSLNLLGTFVMGVTLNNCTNLLSAVTLATSLLSSDRYRTALIISSDKVADENYRFTDACLYSDAATSFVMTKSNTPGFEVLSDGFCSDHRLVENKSVFSDVRMYQDLHHRMAERDRLDVKTVTRLFTNNVYLPILRIKESCIGLSNEQLFLENVPRISHCFSADPFINLSDYSAAHRVRAGETFMLTSNSAGLRSAMAIRYTE